MKIFKNKLGRGFENKSKGFTLIELLVVISIIALLSSIVLATLQTAREKAQISKFTQEMLQAQNALELYYSSNKQYPPGSDYGVPIQTLITNNLSSYIKPISIPSFLNSTNPAPYLTKGNLMWMNTITCGTINAPEYFIQISSNIPLPPPFMPIYVSGVQVSGTPPYDHVYCISPTK